MDWKQQKKWALMQREYLKHWLFMVDAKDYAVGVIPVAEMLSMKQIAKAAGAKKSSYGR